MEQATKSKIFLLKKIDKAKEDIEDLRFQHEEKNIELEGTRAQLRVLESKTKLDYSPEHRMNISSTRLNSSQNSHPSMKAMVPLAMDEILQNSSSTESAQDQTERDSKICPDTPKRRPSKIPTKAYIAPKPPTGRNTYLHQRSTSGPPSNRSLNKSTSSLYGKSSEPLSVRKESPSLNRPESAQSWRRDSSLSNNNRSSSIPVSSKTSPINKLSYSPLPKLKRDTFTSKVRNMDSLSRIQTTASTTNLYKSNSKKDLSASFSTGQNRDRKPTSVPVRRVSSASVRASELQGADQENGKVRNLRSSFWNWLKI